MPKVVDHEERRHQVLAAVWRVIERDGIEGTTVRKIAREAGYSAGILVHYFEDKDDILTSALRLSHERTRERWAEKLDGRSGLEALRELLLDNLPLDEERSLETRLEISYWARALSSADIMAVKHRESAELRSRLHALALEAQQRDELTDAISADEVTRRLVTLIDGVSLHAILHPEVFTAEAQEQAVERELEFLRPPFTPDVGEREPTTRS